MATNDSATFEQEIGKEICYDRVTHDFALYLDGELVGYARSYHEGEETLDALIYEILTHHDHDAA